jgi:hypothetical protein
MNEQEVKTKMLGYAAKAWGFSDAAIENSFDPLVGLLLGAGAHEISKVYHEIHSTESRLLLKLTQLLTPDVLTGAAPAHSLCHATPVDVDGSTNTLQHFYFQRKIETRFGRDEMEDVFFTPAGSFSLVAAEVRMQASGNKLFAYKAALSKETASTADNNNSLVNRIWIGVEALEDWKYVSELSLFFEHRNPAEANTFYRDLASATFMCNGRVLDVKVGLEDKRSSNKTLHKKLVEGHYNITAQNEEHVVSFYNRQFANVILPEDLMGGSEALLPDHPEEAFPATAFQKIAKKLLWISVDIPAKSKKYSLSDVVCALNCFPVINRKKEEFTYSLHDKHTIIALQSPGRFLDIIDVHSQNDVPYFETAISNPSQAEAGSYLLRHSGIGRFDKRNALEMTEYMLQLLRDESASFSALGKDLVESQVKQVNQLISAIDQRVEMAKKTGDESFSYLIVNALNFPENIFVQYWHTNAESANKVRPGTKLNSYQGSAFMRDSVYLMTSSTGGRNSLSPIESVSVYKNAVLTRQRIVTPKDIETACFMIGGSNLLNVKIEKGVTIEPGTEGNYVRCINVNLHFKPNAIQAEEAMLVGREIQTYLENHSSGMYPFNVVVEN